MDNYQNFIHQARYSRFIDELSRRETWPETVDRLIKFLKKTAPELENDLFEELRVAITNHEVMPSMRLLWSAGPAVEENNLRAYNCSFGAVDHHRAFDEFLFLLMAGAGVGFSEEAVDVNKLPFVNDHFTYTNRPIVIEDSSQGWGKAVRKHIAELYLGNVHSWDYSEIRPEGARLKTMGGRASGPQPLIDLMDFLTKTFEGAKGRKLKTQEVHDIICMIAKIVIVGGVRRSALIALSDLDDTDIRDCKSGEWWVDNVQRALANVSSIYDEKPAPEVFLEEWVALIKSGSGERGIYNRQGVRNTAPKRRIAELIKGCNPCAEISLRSKQLCNLSEVIAREYDTVYTLQHKVFLATVLGTIQSKLTNFPYLREEWRKNCEEERLLGVSLTGIQDCPLLNLKKGFSREERKELLTTLRDYAVSVNFDFAHRLGINPSKAVTTVKPSGTVSQLTNSASGIHGRFSEYYIRSVRQANNDPLTAMMKEQGVPNEPDVTAPDKTTVFYFPIKSPENSVLASEQTAIEQLENWLDFQKYWSEHSVSVTVYVKPHEWIQVGNWVYENFDYITGISFLPYSEHTYEQAPYRDCTEEEYLEAVKNQPEIDFSLLANYEKEDSTEGAKTLACTAGGCEI